MIPRVWTPEELRDPDRLAAAGLAELVGEDRSSAPPAVKNRSAVRALTASGTFVFRGVRYSSRPVGYLAGVDLQLIEIRAKELQGQPETRESLAEFAETIEQLAEIFDAHARPMSRWRRWLRPLLGNPFRAMTEAEAGTLHGFFSQCRRRSSVLLGIAGQESE